MDGFRRSIFDLTYSSSSPGTCSSKLIPDNVEIDCQPSALTTANIEEFSTLKQLKESTSSGIDVSASFQGWGALSALSFGYGFSRQTTYMVDNIIQQGSTMFFTSAKVSHVKLSMFEPEMPLSNRFVYAIKNMPCCVFNSSVQRYVNEFIFGYFGFAYITELMLGGIAQRLVSIRTSDVTKLESEGVNIKHEAKIGFYITMGTTISSGYEKTTQDKFSSKIQNEQSTRLGGDAAVKDLDEWTKTVPDNPVVTRFKIKFFFDLFTSKRFPNEPQIGEKSKLIQQALSEYGKQPPYCYNNCTSPMHGTCKPFEGFNFGVCECNPGFSGIDCSSGNRSPRGILCGLVSNFASYEVPCDGHNVSISCPMDYEQYAYLRGFFQIFWCYKLKTDLEPGKAGTWCGRAGVPYLCGGQSTRSSCPKNYMLYEDSKMCFKVNSTASDIGGTACGFDSTKTNSGTPMAMPCGDGSDVKTCPIGFEPQTFSSVPPACYKM